jgi:hypothetical protein
MHQIRNYQPLQSTLTLKAKCGVHFMQPPEHFLLFAAAAGWRRGLDVNYESRHD